MLIAGTEFLGRRYENRDS